MVWDYAHARWWYGSMGWYGTTKWSVAADSYQFPLESGVGRYSKRLQCNAPFETSGARRCSHLFSCLCFVICILFEEVNCKQSANLIFFLT